VQLNTESLPDDVDLTLNNQNVVPTRGAVVRANFNASVGQRALMTLIRSGGAPVPFGAIVTDMAHKNDDGFIVGDAGQVYLTGLADSGHLLVKWGSDKQEQCQVSYQLSRTTVANAGVQTLNGQCH